jgi:Zn-dependent protease with chaperone function
LKESKPLSIPSHYFVHDADQNALDQLKRARGFSAMQEFMLRNFDERAYRLANSIYLMRLGPEQGAHIYAHLPPACAALGIPEPALYLEPNPVPSSYVLGNQSVSIIVTSGMADLLDESELAAMIAHECGHIACGHVLYQSLADRIATAGKVLWGPLKPIDMAVQIQLRSWRCLSEFSADRAAACVLGSPDGILRALFKLTAGSRSQAERLNFPRFLRELAELNEEISFTVADRALVFTLDHRTHPVKIPVLRARELHRWSQTPKFIDACRLTKDGRGADFVLRSLGVR